MLSASNRARATETILSNDGVIEMDKHSKACLILQEIRDESHRFAINQRKRKIRLLKNPSLTKLMVFTPITKKKKNLL